MAETVVFIPAWNEEANLPAVLEELRGELPDVDVDAAAPRDRLRELVLWTLLPVQLSRAARSRAAG